MNIPQFPYPVNVNSHLGTTLENSTINMLVCVFCLLDKYPEVEFLYTGYSKSFGLTPDSWGWLYQPHSELGPPSGRRLGLQQPSCFSGTPVPRWVLGAQATNRNLDRKEMWVKCCAIMNTAQLNPIPRSEKVLVWLTKF